MTADKSKLTWLVWPPITDEGVARGVIRSAFWVSTFFAAYWAVLAVVGCFLGSCRFGPLWSFGIPMFFAGVAWGLYRLSRIAAVVGFAAFLPWEIIPYLLGTHHPRISRIVFQSLLAIVYLNSIRGTFFYHKLSKEQGSSK